MVQYCPHCWQEIPPGADPCPHCGKPTSEAGVPFVQKLLRTLRQPEPTRAGLAIDILTERLREPLAVDPLIDLLTASSDAAVLKQAVRGLGRLGDVRAIPPLVRLLRDPEIAFVVRGEAASSLGKLGDPAAEAALRAALTDPLPSVAEAARRALAGLHPEEAA